MTEIVPNEEQVQRGVYSEIVFSDESRATHSIIGDSEGQGNETTGGGTGS